MSQFPPPQSPAQPGWGAPQPAGPQPPGPQPWGPGQGPQPGWGQQAPPKKGGGAALGIILALVGIGAAAAAFFLLGGKDDANSPEGVVRALVDASNAGDCERVAELFTEGSAGASDCSTEPEESTIDSIETRSEEGDNAVVVATITNQGASNDFTFQLVRVDGDWKIDSYDLGAAAGGSAGGSSDGESGSGESAGGATSGGGAAGVAAAFVQAIIDGDCEGAAALAADPSSTPDCGSGTGGTIEGVETVSEGDESARVDVSLSRDGDQGVVVIDLVVVDGEWKVAGISEG